MSTIQRTLKNQVNKNTSNNNAFLIQRAVQKIKSDLLKAQEGESAINTNRLLQLKNNKVASGQQVNTAAVFDSLLQKSAIISSKDRNHDLGYEETFNIYK